jgi:hypothetical protein
MYLKRPVIKIWQEFGKFAVNFHTCTGVAFQKGVGVKRSLNFAFLIFLNFLLHVICALGSVNLKNPNQYTA